MKVEVDREVCEANGVCVAIAAEVFDLDEIDVLHIRVAEVPAEHESKVREAVSRCPKQALRLIDESPEP